MFPCKVTAGAQSEYKGASWTLSDFDNISRTSPEGKILAQRKLKTNL
jgi:hypothetical protein